MSRRQLPIDALKVFASQLIVLHHFAAYGPLSDALYDASPRLGAWLYDYARMAVQAFLVLGGFLAAKSLKYQQPLSAPSLVKLVQRRYVRLAPALVAALALTMLCSSWVRPWLDTDFVPAAPGWGQFFAHVLLLHGVLGVDSLSAGVWYVAIDFQLFALFATLLWIGRAGGQALVWGGMLASLFVFNRNAELDNWAVYFFGAYALGAAAYWAGSVQHAGRAARLLWVLMFAGLGALAWDFRGRILLALGVALVLGLLRWREVHAPAAQPAPAHAPKGWERGIAFLGTTSYALFLVHFSVLMLGNALFVRWGLHGESAAAQTLLACWLVAMAAAALFERWVEQPLARLSSRYGP